MLFYVRPWRSWIARQTPTLKAAGSNPVGRTKSSRKLNIYESFFTCKVQNLSCRFDYYFVQNYFLLHYLFFLEEHNHRRSRWLSLSGRSPKWYIQVRDALLDDECTKESEEVLDDLEITFLNQEPWQNRKVYNYQELEKEYMEKQEQYIAGVSAILDEMEEEIERC